MKMGDGETASPSLEDDSSQFHHVSGVRRKLPPQLAAFAARLEKREKWSPPYKRVAKFAKGKKTRRKSIREGNTGKFSRKKEARDSKNSH